jgi:hypothetical protein
MPKNTLGPTRRSPSGTLAENTVNFLRFSADPLPGKDCPSPIYSGFFFSCEKIGMRRLV